MKRAPRNDPFPSSPSCCGFVSFHCVGLGGTRTWRVRVSLPPRTFLARSRPPGTDGRRLARRRTGPLAVRTVGSRSPGAASPDEAERHERDEHSSQAQMRPIGWHGRSWRIDALRPHPSGSPYRSDDRTAARQRHGSSAQARRTWPRHRIYREWKNPREVEWLACNRARPRHGVVRANSASPGPQRLTTA